MPYLKDVGLRKFEQDFSGGRPTLGTGDGILVGDIAIDSSNNMQWQFVESVDGSEKEWKPLDVILDRKLLSEGRSVSVFSSGESFPIDIHVPANAVPYAILANVSIPFDSSTTKYSVGDDNDNTGVGRKFLAPTSIGLVDVPNGSYIEDDANFTGKNVPVLRMSNPENIDGDFGSSLDIDGDYAIVGAQSNDGGGSSEGSAHIFHRDSNGNWNLVSNLVSPTSTARFGHDVAISGDYAVVGSDTGGSTGEAYVFYRSGSNPEDWDLGVDITPAGLSGSDRFGDSVEIDGDYVVVGATGRNGGGSDEGTVFVFNRTGPGNVWDAGVELVSPNAVNSGYFGISSGISGDYLVAGQTFGVVSGSAFVFNRTGPGNVWDAGVELDLPIAFEDSSEAISSKFGGHVAIDGDYVVVGAEEFGANSLASGIAFVYERSGPGNVWGSTPARLNPPNVQENGNFGPCSISGDYVVVTAPGVNKSSDLNVGAAYIYTRKQSNEWDCASEFLGITPKAGDSILTYGFDVSIDSSATVPTILVGDEEDGNGAVYMYDISNYSSEPIRIYRDGSAHTEGTMEVSLFYRVASLLEDDTSEDLLLFMGGSDGSPVDTIDSVSATTDSVNAKGTLQVAKEHSAAAYANRTVLLGGGLSTIQLNTIEVLIPITDYDTTSDKGDLTVSRSRLAAAAVPSLAIFGPGWDGGALENTVDRVDVTLQSSNAVDKGTVSVSRRDLAAAASSQNCFFAGGSTPTDSNVIDYMSFTTTVEVSTDKGDLTLARYALSATSDGTTGVFAGGVASSAVDDTIDRVLLTTTSGNAVDKADLTTARHSMGSANSSQFGYFSGGNDGSVNVGNIEMFNVTVDSGLSTDKGSLTQDRYRLSGGR
jgi:hypothetical protein